MGITIDEVESGIAMPDENNALPEEATQGDSPLPESGESAHKLIETIRRIEYRRLRLTAD
ncbi:hypothetical protein [Desulfobacter sp.]|jgi:hypothetical protein